MENYLVLKKNQFWACALTWMHAGDIMLSKMKTSDKKSSMIALAMSCLWSSGSQKQEWGG